MIAAAKRLMPASRLFVFRIYTPRFIFKHLLVLRRNFASYAEKSSVFFNGHIAETGFFKKHFDFFGSVARHARNFLFPIDIRRAVIVDYHERAAAFYGAPNFLKTVFNIFPEKHSFKGCYKVNGTIVKAQFFCTALHDFAALAKFFAVDFF